MHTEGFVAICILNRFSFLWDFQNGKNLFSIYSDRKMCLYEMAMKGSMSFLGYQMLPNVITSLPNQNRAFCWHKCKMYTENIRKCCINTKNKANFLQLLFFSLPSLLLYLQWIWCQCIYFAICVHNKYILYWRKRS